MTLNLLKLSIMFFSLSVGNPFSFVEPRTLEASEHPFTKTLQNLKGVHKGQNVKGVGELKIYLQKFGYLTNINSSNDNFDENVESALKDYQVLHNLHATGHVDVETIKRMSLPRCGVPDIVTHHKRNRLVIPANYTFFGGSPKWEDRALAYAYKSSADVLSMDVVSQVVESAFQRWSEVTDFVFIETGSDDLADIVMGFHRRDHGDGYPFDVPGRVLAHAFAPQNGRLHYDADEQWSSKGFGIDFETVALHEMGHILGLGHSSNPNSVMYPSYRGVKRNLGPDDVDGIRALYRT